MAKPKLSVAARKASVKEDATPYVFPIEAPKLPMGVVPKGKTPAVALDSNVYTYAQQVQSGTGFPGFAYLSQLATRAEFRQLASTLATELTREWIELTGTDKDDTGKIAKIKEEMKRLGVRDVIRACAEHDAYFGRGQIYIDLKGHEPSDPLILSDKTIAQNSLNRITTVEPIWTTPVSYNSLNPIAPDFYRPSEWYMLGKPVHASRLQTVITRPLPDILKPAFNFAGMSLSQLAEPYVDNWLRTRQSVSDLLNNFSITVLATSMGQVLEGNDDGTDLFTRIKLFTQTRSNKGVMVLDKEQEEIQQVNTPLSGLHELQAQAQEQMCSVSRMPAIVLTGISPGGLNASSDSEIRVFYDWIAAQQEAHYRQPIETIIKVIQLSMFGEIDPTIGFTFVPLYQMTEKEQAEVREINSRSDVAYIGAGVLDPSEVRTRLAGDQTSGYHGIDPGDLPEPPEEPIDPPGGESDDDAPNA